MCSGMRGTCGTNYKYNSDVPRGTYNLPFTCLVKCLVTSESITGKFIVNT